MPLFDMTVYSFLHPSPPALVVSFRPAPIHSPLYHLTLAF